MSNNSKTNWSPKVSAYCIIRRVDAENIAQDALKKYWRPAGDRNQFTNVDAMSYVLYSVKMEDDREGRGRGRAEGRGAQASCAFEFLA